MSFTTKTELLLETLYKKKFNTVDKLEKEKKTYNINKTSIETKLSSLSLTKQVGFKNNKIINKINTTTEEYERKYNYYNEKLEQLYIKKEKEKDIINKQYESEVRKAEDKRERLLEKVEIDSNKYETYLIREKENLEKKTDNKITDLSSNIIDSIDIIDEDKYPILTKSKEIIKLLEDEIETLDKEIQENEVIRIRETDQKMKDMQREQSRRIREEERAAELERQKLIEQLNIQREAERRKDEERWEKQKQERIEIANKENNYLSKEEKIAIEKEKKKVWKNEILSQLEPEYKKIFNECGFDRQAVCYTINDATEVKDYLDTVKVKVEKMLVLDEICWGDNNIEYFNDSSIWEIWKDLPIRIKLAVADLDTKEKQLKMIKQSKNISS